MHQDELLRTATSKKRLSTSRLSKLRVGLGGDGASSTAPTIPRPVQKLEVSVKMMRAWAIAYVVIVPDGCQSALVLVRPVVTPWGTRVLIMVPTIFNHPRCLHAGGILSTKLGGIDRPGLGSTVEGSQAMWPPSRSSDSKNGSSRGRSTLTTRG